MRVARFKTDMAYGLSIENDQAYITTNTRFIVLDIQNPRKPFKTGELKIESPIFGVAIEDAYAFLAASDRGLAILDSTAYVSDITHGLTILDIANPGKVEKVFTVDHTKGATSIVLSDGRLF